MGYYQGVNGKLNSPKNMNTLIEIARNKINAAGRTISAVFPGASLAGHFIGGKPVAKRAWLITPKGMNVQAVMKAANLKQPTK